MTLLDPTRKLAGGKLELPGWHILLFLLQQSKRRVICRFNLFKSAYLCVFGNETPLRLPLLGCLRWAARHPPGGPFERGGGPQPRPVGSQQEARCQETLLRRSEPPSSRSKPGRGGRCGAERAPGGQAERLLTDKSELSAPPS